MTPSPKPRVYWIAKLDPYDGLVFDKDPRTFQSGASPHTVKALVEESNYTALLEKCADKDKEIEDLKKALWEMFLTLGYYRTKYNYDSKNFVYHPETGELASGILWDNGFQAQQASDNNRELFYKYFPDQRIK